jgi:hypothetical protein
MEALMALAWIVVLLGSLCLVIIISTRLAASSSLRVDRENMTFLINNTRYGLDDIRFIMTQGDDSSYGGGGSWWKVYIICLRDRKCCMTNTLTPRALLESRLLNSIYTEWRLPKFIAALDAGESLRFGRLVLRGNFVSLEGSGFSAPCATFCLRHDNLIFTTEGVSGFAVPCKNMPDCGLLVRLLHHRRNTNVDQ